LAQGSCSQSFDQADHSTQRRWSLDQNPSSVRKRKVDAGGAQRCLSSVHRDNGSSRNSDHFGIFNLNTQKTVNRSKISRALSLPRKAQITQPFIDEVGIHRITQCYLRDRSTLNPRLTANLALHASRHLTKTALSRTHKVPLSVHYRWWTLRSAKTKPSVRVRQTLTNRGLGRMSCILHFHVFMRP
jgi:hypothetical protein